MVQLLTSPWRSSFSVLLGDAEESLILASPFIKESEAVFVLETLRKAGRLGTVDLTVLTDFRTESVLSGSLDVTALQMLADEPDHSQVISVPRLHAKVYVADSRSAVVTSANLTPSGLDGNMEYGVALSAGAIVHEIRSDILGYARLGSVVASEVISDLVGVGLDLAREYEELVRSAKSNLRNRFSNTLREATERFIATQVGARTAHAVFSEAIVYLLSRGPLTTAQLQPRIQHLLPDLCDDSLELVINGQQFGKKWKHHVRNSQQSLKSKGLVRFDGRRWMLAR